jgi:DNA repair photolyase
MEGNDKRVSKHEDWTKSKNNVNICTGCPNDCLYCYSKSMGYSYGWAQKGHWQDEIIRQKDVDKKRKLYDGLVGFPTSHDITPHNIDAYLRVLDKLLGAGNEVLITTKPRMECIQRICHPAGVPKDRIIFRFTIGAMDDEILSYWEPNAPLYDERKDALAYAFQRGFKTSVSVEPMLDSPNIEMLVRDLEPYVNDAIWIGKMDHIEKLKENADTRLLKELEIIEFHQRDEMISAIYKTYKDNPKIKWKSSIKEVVGIE